MSEKKRKRNAADRWRAVLLGELPLWVRLPLIGATGILFQVVFFFLLPVALLYWVARHSRHRARKA